MVGVSFRLRGIGALPAFEEDSPKWRAKFFKKLRGFIEADKYWYTEMNADPSPGQDYDPAENETIVFLRAEVHPHTMKGLSSKEWDLKIIDLIENAREIEVTEYEPDLNDYGGKRKAYQIGGSYPPPAE